MADPLSAQILDNLVDTIAAIEAGDTYERTVRVCTRLTYLPAEISQYDAVFVYDNGVTKNYRASNVTHCQQNVSLDCWVQDNDPAQAVDQLAADIEKALAATYTRGGLAIDTKIQAIRKLITQEQGPEANCEIDIVIDYRHTEGDPYTSIGG